MKPGLLVMLSILSFSTFAQFYAVNNTPYYKQILKVDSNGSDIKEVSNFNFTDAYELSNPSLTEGTNGLLYGVATKAANGQYGCIYSYDPVNEWYKLVYKLQNGQGSGPENGLLLAANGKFYGTTKEGGNNNKGVLFSFDLSTNIYTVLHHFTAAEANGIKYKLIEPIPGMIYGNSTTGGTGHGSIYSYDIQNNLFQVRASLTFVQGSGFTGELTIASNTSCFGLTSGGGNNSMGTILEYNYSTNTLIKKLDFLSIVQQGGGTPAGPFTRGNGNILYGCFRDGGDGSIFKYSYSNNGLSKVLAFDTVTGSRPLGKITFSNSGKLYSSCEYTTNQTQLPVLFSFDTINKAYHTINMNPYARFNDLVHHITRHSNGKLYGTSGSIYGSQRLFGIVTSNDTLRYEMLYNSAIRGSGYMGKLCKGAGGYFYGVTSLGGYENKGLIYEFNQITKEVKPVFVFTDSLYPHNLSLVLHSNGKVYGAYKDHHNGTNRSKIYSIDASGNMQVELVDSALVIQCDGAMIEGASGSLLFPGYDDLSPTKLADRLVSFNPANNTLSYITGLPNITQLWQIFEADSGEIVYVAQSNLVYHQVNGGALNQAYNFANGNLSHGFMKEANTLYGVFGNNNNNLRTFLFTYNKNTNLPSTILSLDSNADFRNLAGNYAYNPVDAQYYFLAHHAQNVNLSRIGVAKYSTAVNGLTTTCNIATTDTLPQINHDAQLVWDGYTGAYQPPNPNAVANIKKENLLIYPNPCFDQFQINSSLNGIVKIYNGLGNLLLSQNKTSTRHNVNIASYPAGVYFVFIHSKDGNVCSKLLKY